MYDDLEDGYVKTSLGMIHYKQHPGSGTGVLFIHGFAASTKSWVKLIEWLPDDLNVCLIDLLGHGVSDAPRIGYGAAVQARTVREFVEARGLQDSYLFGHSYGGWIAALLAQGGLGGGVVLEDAMGLKDYFTDLAEENRADAFNDRWVREARIFGLADHVIESSVGADKASDSLTRESLSGVTKPTLLVWGGKDGVVPVKYAQLFSEYIRGSALEVLPDAGHVPHYTNAKEVAGMLMRFIRNP